MSGPSSYRPADVRHGVAGASKLVGDECLDQRLLVRPKRVHGLERAARLAAKQDRRALSFIIAEVGTVLPVADQCCQIRGETGGNLRRISQPLVLVGLEPAKAVGDDRSPPRRSAFIAAGAMEGRAEEQERRAWLHFDSYFRRFDAGRERSQAVAFRPDQS